MKTLENAPKIYVGTYGSITMDCSLENGLISQTTLIAKLFIRTTITEMNFSATAAGQS